MQRTVLIMRLGCAVRLWFMPGFWRDVAISLLPDGIA
ncbi:hypothetical protein B23_1793 [Geobacillus thermoleovorans B23]|nr:hypothetical protein B23_1793 [Geobacillus thermoleovorans B23]